MIIDFDPNDPKWINRMSIQRKHICEKCNIESYCHNLYTEYHQIFYCCTICAEKYEIKKLTDLLK